MSAPSSRPQSASEGASRGQGAGATSDLVKLLQLQKQEHQRIAKDPIFREYQTEVRRKELVLRRRGWKEAPRPHVDDDLDAEAQHRIMALISGAAADASQPLTGVWARFGKPYKPLGVYQELPADMPARLRAPDDGSDAEVDSARKVSLKSKSGRPARRSHVAKALSALTEERPGSADEEEAQKLLFRKSILQFSTVERCEAMFPNHGWGGKRLNVQKPTRDGTKRVAASQARMPWVNEAAANAERNDPTAYGAVLQKASCGKELAAAVTKAVAARLERATGTLHRRTMQTIEQLGTSREEQAVPSAAALLAKHAKADGGASIKFSAETQSQDARKRGRSVTLLDLCEADSTGSVSETDDTEETRARAARARGCEASTSGRGVSLRRFLHQGDGIPRRSTRIRCRLPSDRGPSLSRSQRASLAGDIDLAGRADPLGEDHRDVEAVPEDANSSLAATANESGGKPPAWTRLTELVRVPPGQERNPVFKWHNTFVEVRHKGRDQLQEMLWTRLQGRCASRSSTALTAGLCKAMAAELAFSGGTLGNVIMRGKPPRDPYDQAKLFIDHDSDGPSGARRTGASLQLEDVHLLERFYNQLCLLVEAQKASDPLSLVIVQLVKELLESGLTLHAPLLTAIVTKFGAFVASIGMRRYNFFLLPIFTFIRKCCGATQEDLEHLLDRHKLDALVFPPPGMPARPITPLTPSRSSTPASQGTKTSQCGRRSSGRIASGALDRSHAVADLPPLRRSGGAHELPPRPPSRNAVVVSAAKVDHAAQDALAKCKSLEGAVSGHSSGAHKARFADACGQSNAGEANAALGADIVQGATSTELPPQH